MLTSALLSPVPAMFTEAPGQSPMLMMTPLICTLCASRVYSPSTAVAGSAEHPARMPRLTSGSRIYAAFFINQSFADIPVDVQ